MPADDVAVAVLNVGMRGARMMGAPAGVGDLSVGGTDMGGAMIRCSPSTTPGENITRWSPIRYHSACIRKQQPLNTTPSCGITNTINKLTYSAIIKFHTLSQEIYPS